MNIENAKLAYKILSRIPNDRFVPMLETFFQHDDGIDLTGDQPLPSKKDVHKCGTWACAAGWLMVDKRFRDDKILRSYLGANARGDIFDVWQNWAAKKFDGSSDTFDLLFSEVGDSDYDYDLAMESEGDDGLDLRELPAKLVALYRLRRFMDEPSPEAYARAKKDCRE
jgi:hypothetical protein